MGRQSGRLYYRNRDHKDIYFQGNYHNAMLWYPDADTTLREALIWRKLYDNPYFYYTKWEQYVTSYSYTPAILYPEEKIRCTAGSGINMVTVCGEKYLANKGNDSEYFYWSDDGRFWRKYVFPIAPSEIVSVSPVSKGIMISRYDYSNNKYSLCRSNTS